jgi:hypothetical protein
MKRYFLLPFHGTPLLLVIPFSIGLALASKVGFMGIPLAFLLLSWFFKYCFVVLDSVVAGEDEPPVLSVEMVNPVSEQRPLVLGLLIVVEGTLVGLLQQSLGWLAGLLGLAVFTIALPAQVAVLGVTRNPFKAIWPPALFHLMRALGWDYVLLNGATLVTVGILYGMAAHDAPIWLLVILLQVLFLLTFSLTGGAVFEHRLVLGIDSITRKERLAARDAREHKAKRDHMLDHAYSSFRVRKPLEGWKEIETWLQQHGQGENQTIEYLALLDTASKWDDVRAADRLANDLATLLLARRATGEALTVVERRLATNPRFKMSQPLQAVRLAELAGAAGKRALQRQLTPKA